MRPWLSPPACERARSLIDRLADQDLGASELAELDAHVLSCRACAADLELAEEIAGALRHLPRPLCPPGVAERVLGLAAAEVAARPPAEPSFWQRLRTGLLASFRLEGLGPPVLAGALALLLAAGLTLHRTLERPSYSPEEVARAEQELKVALAYLGRVGSTAGEVVKKQVVTSVIAPTRRAFSSEGNS